MAALALEIQHGIDHVFEHTGTGEGAFLGHMTDQNNGDIALLGDPDHFLRRGPDLSDAAGGAVDGIDKHGLD